MFWEEETYKYCCNVSRIRQSKMQFKAISSVLLFFVAQTMAAANQPSAHPTHINCTLPQAIMVLC